MKIKKGDKVLIVHGKNKGKTGKVIVALPKEERIVVEGINIQKKHTRSRKEGENGQVLEIPGPIYVSNAKLICSNCNKAARVGHKIDGNTKYRVCKKCDKAIK